MTLNNPNIPHTFLSLRAFNIVPGVTFMDLDEPDPRVWIASHVARDGNFETVSVWAHDGTNHGADTLSGLASEKAFNLDYNHKVALVGVVVNPQDDDDNDWGN